MSTQYQPGIPTGTVPLNQDYLNIQKNFTQLNNTYLVDHVAFNVLANNGFHTVIHQVTQTVDPPNSTANQIYSKMVAGDSALFMKSVNGVVQQLSGAFTASGNGSVTLPGGIILKWGPNSPPTTGSFASSHATGSQTFTGYTNIFTVYTSMINNGSTPGNAGTTSVNSVTPSGFNWNFQADGSSSYTGFYWMAIGN